jgi:hypothetical protein
MEGVGMMVYGIYLYEFASAERALDMDQPAGAGMVQPIPTAIKMDDVVACSEDIKANRTSLALNCRIFVVWTG